MSETSADFRLAPQRVIAYAILLTLTAALGCATFGAGRAPRDAHEWVELGKTASQQERHNDAARAFGRALEVDYASLTAHRGLIAAHYNLGRLGELQGLYEKRYEEEPNNPFHAYGLAITLYGTTIANAERALDLLAAAEKLRPKLSDIPYRRAVILLDAERYHEAREALSRALEIEDKARYRAPMALALSKLGEREGSLDLLRGILEMDPTAREVELARIVAERISDPLQGFPRAARGRIERAMAWIEQADVPQKAIDMLREVLLEHPEAAMVHAILGLAYQRIDALGEAIVHMRRAIELAPDLALPRLYLANVMQSLERDDEARKHFLGALERNPFLVEAHAALGKAASERGMSSEAIRHLRAWSLLAPSSKQPRLMLSRSLAATGQLGEAAKILEEVLSMDEDNLEAHLSLATIYSRRHATARTESERRGYATIARRHLDKVLEVQPENAAARRLAAELP